MGDQQPEPTALLTVEKAYSMPFQDVTVMSCDFMVHAQRTLNESQSRLTLTLPPDRYMISGLSPSGTRTKTVVDLGHGEDLTITVDDGQESPHEWLADITARQQLPQSSANVSRNVVDAIGSVSVNSFRDVSPVSSLSLPVGVVSYAAKGLMQDATETLNRRLNLPGRPKRTTRRPQDVNIRTYCWASEHGRWVRSDLIDQAHGVYATDYTRLEFPSRHALANGLQDKIHLVGAFRKDQPARFIALPLFDAGAQLVLSHSGTGGSETEGEVRANSFSWFLSAVDNQIDALVQALKGRGFENSDAVSEEAFKVADRALYEKRRDPEAATVAGLFLLRHRRLDDRANWVENLANWFPWSPDALALGAWANLLFATGDQTQVLSKLAKVRSAGPPQFLPARRLLRDLVSISRSSEASSDLSNDTAQSLDRLWSRLGKEMQNEVQGGPFYSFVSKAKTNDKSQSIRDSFDEGDFANGDKARALARTKRYSLTRAAELAEASYVGRNHPQIKSQWKDSLESDDVTAHMLADNTLLIPGNNSIRDYIRRNLRVQRIDRPRLTISNVSGVSWHQGFLAYSKLIQDWLLEKRYVPSFIIGHSLGAAAAQILSEIWEIPAIAFSAPRSYRGDRNASMGSRCLIVNRTDDPDTNLPDDFMHLGLVVNLGPRISSESTDLSIGGYRDTVIEGTSDGRLPAFWN